MSALTAKQGNNMTTLQKINRYCFLKRFSWFDFLCVVLMVNVTRDFGALIGAVFGMALLVSGHALIGIFAASCEAPAADVGQP